MRLCGTEPALLGAKTRLKLLKSRPMSLAGRARRHFGDTAADSEHRMADPLGIRVDGRLPPLACLRITPTWDALDGRPVHQFALTAPASGLM
jgi:hypothetical protein